MNLSKWKIGLPYPIHPLDFVIPLEFFSLFITPSMFSMIFDFTNMKAEITKTSVKRRPWISTSDAEIDIFVGILLSMGLLSMNRYWDIHSDMHGSPKISQVMTLKRFNQTKRFVKLFNSRTDSDPKSSGFNKR